MTDESIDNIPTEPIEFSPSDCVADLDALATMIEKGRTVIFSPDVRVDREQATAIIRRLREAMPIAIERADEVLQQAEEEYSVSEVRAQRLQEKAAAEAEQTIAVAQTNAETLVHDAQAKAEAIIGRAQTSADEIVGRAQAEADGILNTARARAEELVQQEPILAQANARAADVIAEAETKAQQLKTGADEYCADRLETISNDFGFLAEQIAKIQGQVQAGRQRLMDRVADER